MEVNSSAQGLVAFEAKVLQPLREDLLDGVKATLIHTNQASKLFRYAKKSKRLRSLDCTGTCIDDNIAKLISETINECTSLSYLALRHTRLSPKGLNGIFPLDINIFNSLLFSSSCASLEFEFWTKDINFGGHRFDMGRDGPYRFSSVWFGARSTCKYSKV